MTGTKVIDNAGMPVGNGMVLKHSLIRVVPFEPFSMLLGSAWHDVWSGKQVNDLREKQALRLSPVLRRACR